MNIQIVSNLHIEFHKTQQADLTIFYIRYWHPIFVAWREGRRKVSYFDDMALMGQLIQQRCLHLCITKFAATFREAEVGGVDHTGVFVEFRE